MKKNNLVNSTIASAAVMLMLLTVRVTCAQPGEPRSELRPLLHTYVEIKAYGAGAKSAISAAFAEMERVNAQLNNYNPDSEVAEINRMAGIEAVDISAETMQALSRAKDFGEMTGGAFDFTIGPLVRLWGFDRDPPGLDGRDPDRASVEIVRRLVDYRALELTQKQAQGKKHYRAKLERPGMWIDVGAFSKGFVADRGLETLRQRGIKNALIAAGGTICAMGSKPDGSAWKIGIRHPRKDESFLTVITLKDRTVSTSGDYEKYYMKKGKRRTHIIDPRRGGPVEAVQAVTVIAPSGMTSDSLSTALFVMGPREGIRLVERLPEVEAVVVSKEGELYFSKDWPQRTVVY